MNDWDGLGLPAPLKAEYGWRVDAGLARTPFAAALPEQSQVRTGRRQTFSLAWLLTREQLAKAEPYLLASAYDGQGIALELLTPDGYTTQTVRLAADLEVSPQNGQLFKLRATFETLIPPAACAAVTCDDLGDGVNALCQPPIQVFKLALYALVQGIASGAGVNKINLYAAFNVLGDAANANKVNLYGVQGGTATGSATAKINAYAILPGIATGSAAAKINLYAVISTS